MKKKQSDSKEENGGDSPIQAAVTLNTSPASLRKALHDSVR